MAKAAIEEVIPEPYRSEALKNGMLTLENSFVLSSLILYYNM